MILFQRFAHSAGPDCFFIVLMFLDLFICLFFLSWAGPIVSLYLFGLELFCWYVFLGGFGLYWLVRLAFNFVLILVIVWFYFLDLFVLSGMLNCVDCLDWFCDALADLFLCVVSWICRDLFLCIVSLYCFLDWFCDALADLFLCIVSLYCFLKGELLGYYWVMVLYCFDCLN